MFLSAMRAPQTSIGPSATQEIRFCDLAAPNVVTTNETIGMSFICKRSGRITGVRYRYGAAAATTLRGRLWTGGVSVRSADLAVPGPGLYDITFSAPYSVTANQERYIASVYDPAGTVTYSQTRPWNAGPLEIWSGVLVATSGYPDANAAGDNNPGLNWPNGWYHLDPIFVPEL